MSPKAGSGGAQKENPFSNMENGARVKGGITPRRVRTPWSLRPTSRGPNADLVRGVFWLTGVVLATGGEDSVLPGRSPVNGCRATPNTAARLRRIRTVFRFSKGHKVQ